MRWSVFSIVVLMACGRGDKPAPAPASGSAPVVPDAAVAIAIDAAPDAALPTAGPAAPNHVLLVGEQLYLEGALLTVDQIELAKLGFDDYERDPSVAETASVVIFHGRIPKLLPKAPHLIIFAPTAATSPIPLRGNPLTRPHITEVAAHPVVKDLTFEDVVVEASVAFDVEDNRGETGLVMAMHDPVIAVKVEGKRKLVVIGFALDKSDLPLRTAFPLLLHNSLRWFGVVH